MKVKDLIKELLACDENLEVVLSTDDPDRKLDSGDGNYSKKARHLYFGVYNHDLGIFKNKKSNKHIIDSVLIV